MRIAIARRFNKEQLVDECSPAIFIAQESLPVLRRNLGRRQILRAALLPEHVGILEQPSHPRYGLAVHTNVQESQKRSWTVANQPAPEEEASFGDEAIDGRLLQLLPDFQIGPFYIRGKKGCHRRCAAGRACTHRLISLRLWVAEQ